MKNDNVLFLYRMVEVKKEQQKYIIRRTIKYG